MIEDVAEYITNKVYPTPSEDSVGMKSAVSGLLDILMLNAGIVLATYCISTSLSILSILLTGASSFFIYKIIRKIYIDIRTDPGASIDLASAEFSKIVGVLTDGGWNYLTWGFSQLTNYRSQ